MSRLLSAAAATSFLASLAWWPGACPWALPILFVPLWSFCLREPLSGRILLCAFLFQVLGGSVGFYWIAPTVSNMFGFSKFIAGLTLLIFDALGLVYFTLSHFLWARLRPKLRLPDLPSLLLLACLFYLFECLVPTLFPFNFGYPWMWARTGIVQWAGVVGVSGLSFFTMLLNVVATWGWLGWLNGERRRAAAAAVVMLLSLAAADRGGAQLKKSWSRFDKEIRIGYAQGSLPTHGQSRSALGANYREWEFRRYEELTEDAIRRDGKPDVFLWPENVMLVRINTDDPFSRKIKSLAARLQIPLMAGLQSVPDQKLPGDPEYGSIVSIDSSGKTSQIYNKLTLVPLGESIPSPERFPIFKTFLRGGAPMLAGSDIAKGISKHGGVKFGTNMCYEALNPWFARAFVKLGAQVLINLSSDAWFGPTIEPYQHAYMAMARAIEFRRPLIRVANTGISSAILANGEVTVLANPYESKSGVLTLGYLSDPPPSAFQAHGDLLSYFVLLLAAALIFLGRRESKLKEPGLNGED